VPPTLNLLAKYFLCSLLICVSFHAFAGLPEIIKKIKPSIVGVGTFNALATPRMVLKGTGFAVKDGTLIVTNNHVTAPIIAAKESELVIIAGTGNNAKGHKATIVARSEAHDLAILKIEGTRLPALKVSNKNVREGMDVAFTGFPIGSVLGIYPVTHRGIISSLTPIAVPAASSRGLSASIVRRLRDSYFVYQLDATAYPGNSGSPLFDQSSGEVIGVINKVFVKKTKESALTNPTGITYAIPSTLLKELLETL